MHLSYATTLNLNIQFPVLLILVKFGCLWIIFPEPVCEPEQGLLWLGPEQNICQMNESPQAPDRFNPKVTVNTCGIIQKLYETKHIETMMSWAFFQR